HSERAGPVGYRAADATVPHDAERCTRELAHTAVPALERLRLPRLTHLRAQRVIESAREIQHHSDHRLRNRLGVYTRGVREHDVALDELGVEQGGDACGAAVDPPQLRAALEPGQEELVRKSEPEVDLGAADRADCL